ncbi:MAG: DUF4124 domain-containing protein [Xanthomonadales bacterium]|nr:DUF4124 domain-containing protein [Xanthomonadales bacterium]
MRDSLRLQAGIALAALAFAGACQAAGSLDHNRYKWRDAQGNLHYGDTLPAEAARLGYEIVNPQGLVVKRVERAKTPEELAAARAAATREQAARTEAEERARADAQLLAGYPEERDLRRAQQQKLELLEQQVVAARISLRSQEQTLADSLARAAEVERTNRGLPEAEAKKLAGLRQQVDNQRLAVNRREAERDAAHENFQLELARYRELRQAAAERSGSR